MAFAYAGDRAMFPCHSLSSAKESVEMCPTSKSHAFEIPLSQLAKISFSKTQNFSSTLNWRIQFYLRLLFFARNSGHAILGLHGHCELLSNCSLSNLLLDLAFISTTGSLGALSSVLSRPEDNVRISLLLGLSTTATQLWPHQYSSGACAYWGYVSGKNPESITLSLQGNPVWIWAGFVRAKA